MLVVLACCKQKIHVSKLQIFGGISTSSAAGILNSRYLVEFLNVEIQSLVKGSVGETITTHIVLFFSLITSRQM